MGRIEDRYDDTAPCTENLEQQDQAEGDHDLHPDFTGNYNLSDDLGIPSVDSTELPEDEYRRVLLTCEAARQRGVRGTMRGVRGIAISLIFTHDHIVGSSVELIEVVFFKVHR